jgi:hypothetical protein
MESRVERSGPIEEFAQTGQKLRRLIEPGQETAEVAAFHCNLRMIGQVDFRPLDHRAQNVVGEIATTGGSGCFCDEALVVLLSAKMDLFCGGGHCVHTVYFQVADVKITAALLNGSSSDRSSQKRSQNL